MTWDDIQGLVRHALTSAGGALVAQGYLGSDDLNTAVGALVALIGVAWSIWNKRQHRAQLAAATASK